MGFSFGLLRNEQDVKWFDEDVDWTAGFRDFGKGPVFVVNLTKTTVKINKEGCEYWRL